MLLPVALQIELVAAAIYRQVGLRVGVALTDLAVQDPLVLVDGHPDGAVRVVGALPSNGRRGRIAVRGPDGARHLSVLATPIAERAIARRVPRSGPQPDLPGQAGLIYPPMFHGPAFQVIDRFGRRGDHLVSSLPADPTAWTLLDTGEGRVAQLVELLFQTCGVWELTETGRMMRPARIDRLEISPSAGEPPSGVWADVWPSPANPSAFDGVVRDADERVRVRMLGYRPVELGPPLPGLARSLTSHLRSSAALHHP